MTSRSSSSSATGACSRSSRRPSRSRARSSARRRARRHRRPRAHDAARQPRLGRPSRLHAAGAARRPDHRAGAHGHRRRDLAQLHGARDRRGSPDLRPEHDDGLDDPREPLGRRPAATRHRRRSRCGSARRSARRGGSRWRPPRQVPQGDELAIYVQVGEVTERTAWLHVVAYAPFGADVSHVASEIREQAVAALASADLLPA